MLQKTYGKGRWRKLKGRAMVEALETGEGAEAEVRGYEAHGVGRHDMKVKKVFE